MHGFGSSYERHLTEVFSFLWFLQWGCVICQVITESRSQKQGQSLVLEQTLLQDQMTAT